MVTRLDYPEDEVRAAHSALLEVLTALGAYRDSIVLVGGWVPPLTFPNADHVGSLDIDLALDEQKITDREYETILECLKSAEYRACSDPDSKPNQFERDVIVDVNKIITVRLDLLAAEYGGTGRSNRHQNVQGIKARKARGSDLAFQYYKTMNLAGTLPGGGTNSVTVHIAEIAPFLVMKGMAIFDRKKQKDAYDIHFCLQHFPGGIDALVQEFQPLKENKLAKEGLGKMRSKFSRVTDIGPVWAAQFVSAMEDDFEIVSRDAFERVTLLLDSLNVAPWEPSQNEN